MAENYQKITQRVISELAQDELMEQGLYENQNYIRNRTVQTVAGRFDVDGFVESLGEEDLNEALYTNELRNYPPFTNLVRDVVEEQVETFNEV